MKFRVGHGIDIHRYKEGDHIILGGVRIPHTHAIDAHSDGDVVLHAICDAVLGACALGDIGHHFPDTDPEFAGADSCKLLSHCISLAQNKGFKLSNLDVTIVAQAPKIAPYIERMRLKIANLFSCDIGAINVKATTTEKLGYIGRKEGIATHAVCLLENIS